MFVVRHFGSVGGAFSVEFGGVEYFHGAIVGTGRHLFVLSIHYYPIDRRSKTTDHGKGGRREGRRKRQKGKEGLIIWELTLIFYAKIKLRHYI